MSDFDFDLLNELVDEAPTAGFGPQVNFGNMKITSIVVTGWNNDTKKFDTRPYDNKPINKDKEHLQITFECDMSEFNPMLVNPYKRRVDVQVSGKKSNGELNPKALTDWSQTVEPSGKSVIGKDWLKRLLAKGVYVEWEDAETVERYTKDNPAKGQVKGELKFFTTSEGKVYVNSVPRFRRAFKSKAECEIARAERFAKRENGTSTELDLGNASDIPADVIKDARGLIQAVGLEQAKTILETNAPYSDYDLEKLITVANPL